ncbi:MAG: aminotransferase class I/II-fold pyridoxal phosphate-dependent enzyme [Myxococcota bacterium]|nr:aminotransferase class I/II-fold pyridoxal phosphate-dependent enzyme [Myxococcota bacterium]
MSNHLETQMEPKLPEPIAGTLSRKGRSITFPKKGILGQSAAARGRKINGTIGIALDEQGQPMFLDGLAPMVDLPVTDMFPYASSFGKPELRQRWLQMILDKNPKLNEDQLSQPVVTNALTHGLSVAGSLFLDPGDQLILADRFWGNYKLIFQHTYDAELETFPTFDGAGFNTAGMLATAQSCPGKKVVLLLNFPNNPTGYTCTVEEAKAIRDALISLADSGREVVVLIDDAYFGLVYEDGIMKDSIFSWLADAHERLLAVKIDGATKEDFAWGYRVGFLTFAFKGATTSQLAILEDKAAATVRATISNASHLGQSLMLAAYNHADYPSWKDRAYQQLKCRYDTVRRVFRDHPEYAASFIPQPFNSGYFLCVKPIGVDSESVRLRLLDQYDVGVIAAGDLIRVAYSSVPSADLPDLFESIHLAIRSLA